MSTEVNAASPDLFSVLPFFSSQHLSLQELACLAACSKQLVVLCCTVAKQDALDFLVAELEAAGRAATAAARAETDSAERWRYSDDEDLYVGSTHVECSCESCQINAMSDAAHYQRAQAAVAWLLQIAPAVATAAGAAECLLGIPAVSYRCALQLVAAGVRVSYCQLLAAANSMVAGVQVWVEAQHQLVPLEDGIHADMPEKVHYICWKSRCAYVSVKPIMLLVQGR
jgi:hypothetical protein